MRELYDRHRGPFTLNVTRRADTRTGFSGEWLKTPLKGRAADAEARRLLETDADVIHVHVYSESEQQFIGANYRRDASAPAWVDTVTNVETTTRVNTAHESEDSDMAKKAAKKSAAAKSTLNTPATPVKVTKSAVKDAKKAAAASGARASHPYFVTRKTMPEGLGGQKRAVYDLVAAAGDSGMQKAAILEAAKTLACFKAGKNGPNTDETISNNVSFYLSKLKGDGLLRIGRDAEPVGEPVAQ